MQTIKIIKKSELDWRGESGNIVIQKPDEVLDVEHFLLTPADQEQRSLQGIAYLKDIRFTKSSTIWHPLAEDKGKEFCTRLSREIGITQHVLDKWADFAVDHSTEHSSVKVYLGQSRFVPLDDRIQHTIRFLFKAKPFETIEHRVTQLCANTQLNFFIVENVLLEFVTFRGVRQLKRMARRIADGWKTNQPSEKERIQDISKQSFRREIQGGLLRQERSPRDRWAKK